MGAVSKLGGLRFFRFADSGVIASANGPFRELPLECLATERLIYDRHIGALLHDIAIKCGSQMRGQPNWFSLITRSIPVFPGTRDRRLPLQCVLNKSPDRLGPSVTGAVSKLGAASRFVGIRRQAGPARPSAGLNPRHER